MEHNFHPVLPWLIPFIVVKLWDMTWKIFALLKAAKNNHLAWFVFILLFNTAGILPIIYILMQKKIRVEQM